MERTIQLVQPMKLAERKLLRVAAYARVSCDKDAMKHSLAAQISYYNEYIQRNPDWVFAGIYADEAYSGTKDDRPRFMQLIQECKDGKIDRIITKSISRFARNTLDCLKYIRELKEKNIPVFFEKENINTMDSKGEVLLTIMASLAQQESQSLSQNIKLGLQYRFQNGEVRVNHSRFLGYTKDEEGNLIIEPAEAEVVKRIYREYLEGASLLQIGRGLEADGILTGAGKTKWRPETLKKILQNEKYIGDALSQKSYSCGFPFVQKRNHGERLQYYTENSHPAIIDRDTFERVQALLAELGLDNRDDEGYIIMGTRRVSVDILVNNENEAKMQIAETLRETLRSVGLDATVTGVPFTEYQTRVSER